MSTYNWPPLQPSCLTCIQIQVSTTRDLWFNINTDPILPFLGNLQYIHIQVTATMGFWFSLVTFINTAPRLPNNTGHLHHNPTKHHPRNVSILHLTENISFRFPFTIRSWQWHITVSGHLCHRQTRPGHSPCRLRCWWSAPAPSRAGWPAAPLGTPAWKASCRFWQAAEDTEPHTADGNVDRVSTVRYLHTVVCSGWDAIRLILLVD